MSSEFSPVDRTKMGQLEHLLQTEQKIRAVRDKTHGQDFLYRFPNPDAGTFRPEEPKFHEVAVSKALLRGMLKAKRTLHDDIVYDMRKNHMDNRFVRRIQPEKKLIVDGVIQAYQKEDGIR